MQTKRSFLRALGGLAAAAGLARFAPKATGADEAKPAEPMLRARPPGKEVPPLGTPFPAPPCRLRVAVDTDSGASRVMEFDERGYVTHIGPVEFVRRAHVSGPLRPVRE